MMTKTKRFDTHEEFFEKIGEDYFSPTAYGESIYSITVEELYQHFRDRMMKEINAELLKYCPYCNKEKLTISKYRDNDYIVECNNCGFDDKESLPVLIERYSERGDIFPPKNL